MKNLNDLNQILFPTKFKLWGKILLIGGVPLSLLMITLLVFMLPSEMSDKFPDFWDEWGLFIIHIPISVGLFWMLFAREKDEDEMYLTLRLKATIHGIRFIFIAILMLPLFSNLTALFLDKVIGVPDIGGNLAVVTLLLVYANGAYYMLKKEFNSLDQL